MIDISNLLNSLKASLNLLVSVCYESKYFELKNRLIVYEIKYKKFKSENEPKFANEKITTTTTKCYDQNNNNTSTTTTITNEEVLKKLQLGKLEIKINHNHFNTSASPSSTSSSRSNAKSEDYENFNTAPNILNNARQEFISPLIKDNAFAINKENEMFYFSNNQAISSSGSPSASANDKFISNNLFDTTHQLRFRRINPVMTPILNNQQFIDQQRQEMTASMMYIRPEMSNKSTWVNFYAFLINSKPIYIPKKLLVDSKELVSHCELPKFKKSS